MQTKLLRISNLVQTACISKLLTHRDKVVTAWAHQHRQFRNRGLYGIVAPQIDKASSHKRNLPKHIERSEQPHHISNYNLGRFCLSIFRLFRIGEPRR